MVDRYYIGSFKNAESKVASEEQGKEQELDYVGQTEQYSIHSVQKIDEKEQGISNNDLEDYSCYYCDYRTNNKDGYEHHVVLTHSKRAYPNKAEIEKGGLKAQGKDWEI